jgi:hypothetical protein
MARLHVVARRGLLAMLAWAGVGLFGVSCGKISTDCAEIRTCTPDDATTEDQSPPATVVDSTAEEVGTGSEGDAESGADEGGARDAGSPDGGLVEAGGGAGGLGEAGGGEGGFVDGGRDSGDAVSDAAFAEGSLPDVTLSDGSSPDATLPDAGADAGGPGMDSGADSTEPGPEAGGGDATDVDARCLRPIPCDSGLLCCGNGCCVSGALCCPTTTPPDFTMYACVPTCSGTGCAQCTRVP